jgi:hypothetical protein
VYRAADQKADIVDERQFFRRNIIHRRRIECTCHKSLKRRCVKTGSSVFQFHGGTDLPANQNWRGLRMQPLRECLGFPRIPVCVFALGSIIENSYGAISGGGIEPIDHDIPRRSSTFGIDAVIAILILDVHFRPHQFGEALSRLFVLLVNSAWRSQLVFPIW